MTRKQHTMDGNEAAAYVSYAFTEVATIYPITPSSPMAEHVDAWASVGMKNIFGQKVRLVEMQSEAGAAAAMHGALETGALATTYTASQGLGLMIPTIYRTAGSLYPGVYHVSSRTLGTHALSIYGDHSDVMACRQTGVAQLNSGSVQEVMDLAAVAHLSAIEGSVPFMHFFDGFRTSHEIQKIDVLEYDELEGLLNKDALKKFKKHSLHPERPVQRGLVQNPDTYFQSKEAVNTYYDNLPAVVEKYMNKINELTGRDYKLFNYYGASDAENIIVAMGSVSGLVKNVVDDLNRKGEKLGYLHVHLYRPFSVKHFLNELPKTVKRIVVLDRTKEAGAIGDPLYLDVVAAFANKKDAPEIYSGRYGLSSKDVDHAQIKAVFDNLKQKEVKDHFTVGIVDDVTFKSIPIDSSYQIDDKDTVSCKFWGLGSDGTVGANKNSIKIIGEKTNLYVQAYFEYDAKKSGGITKSNLRFGKNPIRNSNVVKEADFVACHNQSYIGKYEMVQETKKGGVFLLNTGWNLEELEDNLPDKDKRYIADNDIKFYTIDATKIGKEIGLGNKTNTILQSAFFKLAEIIPMDEAEKYMKEFAYNSYNLKGEKIVNMNYRAIEEGYKNISKVDIKDSWKNIEVKKEEINPDLPEFIREVLIPINAQKGDDLPVSAFVEYADGHIPVGSSKYEKRGIASEVPHWNEENCIQCNQCSFVCPHAAIRPFLLNNQEVLNGPESLRPIEARGKGMQDYKFMIQVSPLDCTGCGNCVDICPAKEKALSLNDLVEEMNEAKNWEYAMSLSHKENPMDKFTLKGSQFEQPLLEFSGACAGCSQTAYARILTQFYGDRIYIANATGCTQAWGAAFPQVPYTTNKDGFGPAWSNLLFENNAEFSLGMCLSVNQQREKLALELNKLKEELSDQKALKVIDDWFEGYNDGNKTTELSKNLVELLEKLTLSGYQEELRQYILDNKEHLRKKSLWMYGGDGWAYDIGYGGLDHVLASGEDVNILVVDNELYANTGGQASKSTPKGSIVQFAAGGKKTAKKDLGLLAMAYKDVYVAKIALGANMNQAIKAIKEAEEYPGTSLIVAYSPCINHGIVKGMSHATREQKDAVEAGYWHLYRYNPLLEKEGKNPFILDSKDPTRPYNEFLQGENRYASLLRKFPEEGVQLLEDSGKDAEETLKIYKSYADK